MDSPLCLFIFLAHKVSVTSTVSDNAYYLALSVFSGAARCMHVRIVQELSPYTGEITEDPGHCTFELCAIFAD